MGVKGTQRQWTCAWCWEWDEDIEPMLERWRMDLAERGLEIRKKPGQEVHPFDKFMVLGAPTNVPPSVMERR